MNRKAHLTAIIVLLGLFLVSSLTHAAPISVNDQFTIPNQSGAWGPTGGGELYIRNLTQGNAFYSFCLEINEYLTPGETYRVDSITSYAVKGGGGATGGMDPISNATKWLFYQWWTGALAPYGKTNSGSYGEGALQLAIWGLENEITNLTYTDGYLTYDGSYFYNLALQHAADGTNLPVFVVNPTGPIGSSTSTDDARSFMIVATPEPMTMLFLGFGILGLAGMRRFKK